MGFLDIFALLILAVLAASLVGLWVLLGMLPGRIARKRQHPQADAISVCGWWGAVKQGASPAEVDMQNIEAFYIQKGEYIDATRDEILKKYGSVEHYMTQGLGLAASEVTELRKRMLK